MMNVFQQNLLISTLNLQPLLKEPTFTQSLIIWIVYADPLFLPVEMYGIIFILKITKQFPSAPALMEEKQILILRFIYYLFKKIAII